MELRWIGHATVLIEMDGTRLLTDPVLGGRIGPLVRVAAPVDLAALSGIDAVLISHLHADHAQPRSLRRVAGGAIVLAPRGAAAWLRRRGAENVAELEAADELTVGGVSVRAMPATHGRKRAPLGPSADPIGFVLRGSHAVYFAGDTALFDGMAALSGTIDVALLPVWGWGPELGPGHLDPADAARAAAIIGPRVAIPIHWGTYSLPGRFAGRAAGDEPAREFAAKAAREAPGVEVRVLRPGEHIALD